MINKFKYTFDENRKNWTKIFSPHLDIFIIIPSLIPFDEYHYEGMCNIIVGDKILEDETEYGETKLIENETENVRIEVHNIETKESPTLYKFFGGSCYYLLNRKYSNDKCCRPMIQAPNNE
jgi:hypothetical protein